MPTSAGESRDVRRGHTGPIAVASPADVGTSGGPPQVDDDRGRFRLGHRPELDGVRGIAVLLVVVYHTGRCCGASPADRLAPGGFLGVDLFFALSGFLITVLLLDEADRRGRVRARRLRRCGACGASSRRWWRCWPSAGGARPTDQTYEPRRRAELDASRS